MIEQFRDFLEGGLGIHIGTRNSDLEPSGARVAAVRVDDDGLHLLVYIAEVAAPRVLADLQSNGQAAVVFARPTDDRACQVKGQFVGVRPARAEEQPFVEAQWARFLDNVEKIGVSRSITRGWITWPAVAIRLRASAVFEQTPGPDAGAALAVER